MCACDESPGFVCSQCRGTPFDPRYEEDAYEPMDTGEFGALVESYAEPWQGWA